MTEYGLAIKELDQSDPYRHLQYRDSQRVSNGFDEKKLVRRIDCRILPLLCLIYFVQFMDKIILNYANVMGIQNDLKMKPNDFSWAATAFSIGYGVAGWPQAAFLQAFPVTKVLGINMFMWGLVTASTGAAQTSVQLLGLRTLLGVLEAVVIPSLIMITAAWYKRREGAYRFGIWFCGLGLGQILGGFISFGAQHSKSSLQGWRIIFFCVGAMNIIVSCFVYHLPSSPEEATFLSATDKEFTIRRLKEDHAGVGAKVLRLRSVFEVILDVQTWLLCLITLLTTLCSGVVVYYSAILIKGFGYNSKTATLLNIPCGAVGIIATVAVAYVVRNGYHRWLVISIACVPAMLGSMLMTFLPANHKAGMLAGIYLINTAPAVYALVLMTAGANYRGYTRKLAGSAMIAASFSIANIIGPQTFQARDAPNYLPAKVTLIVAMGVSISFAIGLRVLYLYRNSTAEKRNEPAMSHFERDAILARGKSVDFGDRGYRYSY